MKKLLLTFMILLMGITPLCAQDEGEFEIKERIELNKNIFLDFGITKNFWLAGDYVLGFRMSAGYLKRTNRFLSIGVSLGLSFYNLDDQYFNETDWDAEALLSDVGNSTNTGNAFIGFNSTGQYRVAVVSIDGGDLSMIELGVPLKINFVPVRDDSWISVYALGIPYILLSNRASVSGNGDFYDFDPSLSEFVYVDSRAWDETSEGLEGLAARTQFSAGVFLGGGLELFPAKRISFFTRAGFTYTLPIEYVDTFSYFRNIELDYNNDEFPLSQNFGFTTINLVFGSSFNF